jgi:hypothetical protein
MNAGWRWPAAILLVAAFAVAVLVLTMLRYGQSHERSPGPSGQPTATPEDTSGPSPAGPIAYVIGSVTSGPVCPVVRSPEPSECAPRPVAGAVIVASNVSQGEVERVTTAADGTYRLVIHGYGTYTLTPQPVQGLMGVAAPITVTLEPMETRRVDFAYDTGIR